MFTVGHLQNIFLHLFHRTGSLHNILIIVGIIEKSINLTHAMCCWLLLQI